MTAVLIFAGSWVGWDLEFLRHNVATHVEIVSADWKRSSPQGSYLLISYIERYRTADGETNRHYVEFRPIP